jgi:Fur family zinc uptake transcriptional regulator
MAHSHEDHHHEQPPELTRNQGLVLKTLNRADAPLSAYDILDRLREEGLRAPLQVYRALEKLIEQGRAHRLESLNAFVCCADADGHRAGLTAFAICETCGKVDEFSDDVVNQRLGAWTATHDFAARRTTIEIRGKCGMCTSA